MPTTDAAGAPMGDTLVRQAQTPVPGKTRRGDADNAVAGPAVVVDRSDTLPCACC